MHTSAHAPLSGAGVEGSRRDFQFYSGIYSMERLGVASNPMGFRGKEPSLGCLTAVPAAEQTQTLMLQSV